MFGAAPRYHSAYAEVLADDSASGRAHEREAFDRCRALLRRAARTPADPAAQQEAASFVTRLWGHLIGDLARPHNDLPEALRARLMSIGLWAMREVQCVGTDDPVRFEAIAEVCDAVCRGVG